MSGPKIDEVQKDGRPTLLEADKANELIKALNALNNMTVVVGDTNEVIYGSSSIIIQIKRIDLATVLANSPDQSLPLDFIYPLKMQKTGAGRYKIWIDGFSQIVSYCHNGARKIANLFVLKNPYNSNNV